MLENVLIVFLKYPEPGFVKTRLAQKIGNDKAASLYRLFTEAVLCRTKDNRFSRAIFYHPAEKEKEIRDWVGSGMHIFPQKGDNPGENMLHAFKSIFESGAKRAVIIGTHTPALDKNIILESFDRLKKTPCVLGPAFDGGYYLIGMDSLCVDIFKEIAWGRGDVLKKTQGILDKLGLDFFFLPPQLDVDTFNDLRLLKRQLEGIVKVNPAGLEEILEELKGCC